MTGFLNANQQFSPVEDLHFAYDVAYPFSMVFYITSVPFIMTSESVVGPEGKEMSFLYNNTSLQDTRNASNEEKSC